LLNYPFLFGPLVAMSRKLRILIIEDEAAIRTGLIDVFVYHGYEVDFSGHGVEGLNKALTGKFDLILLDVMLPGMNGFEICNRIREQDHEQAIIMLTAKSSDEDIIEGLSLGADDYVAKPFSVAQLVLRVQAVLRRTRNGLAQNQTIQLGNDLSIDCQNLTGRHGAENLSFTRREIDILQYLQSNTERPVSREELLNKVWGYARHLDIETRTVDIHIAKLRRKIEADPGEPQFLVTVRGAGYRLLGQSR
jgi:DNA-binding response OmpR family regulator